MDVEIDHEYVSDTGWWLLAWFRGFNKCFLGHELQPGPTRQNSEEKLFWGEPSWTLLVHIQPKNQGFNTVCTYEGIQVESCY